MVNKLQRVQRLPISLAKAWEYFSSPANLKEITPDYMGFDITSEFREKHMYAGQIISYKVRPFFNIPLSWTTEITHVREPHFFVDEQRVGPYKLWHHQHIFKEIPNGVEMTDIVHYDAGYGFLGGIMDNMIIRGRLDDIFDYRFLKLERLFGSYHASGAKEKKSA